MRRDSRSSPVAAREAAPREVRTRRAAAGLAAAAAAAAGSAAAADLAAQARAVGVVAAEASASPWNLPTRPNRQSQAATRGEEAVAATRSAVGAAAEVGGAKRSARRMHGSPAVRHHAQCLLQRPAFAAAAAAA